MPRDLVGPPVTLTGTVHVGTGCIVLDVRGRRWALFGRAVQALTDGRTATVHGRPIRLPSGCDADQALDVRTIS
jgi:hypothetical protein